MSNTSKRQFLTGVIVGIAISGATVAIASIPDSSSGEIVGCYSTKNGALRVIDAQAGKTCTSGERQIKWPSSGAAISQTSLETSTNSERIDIATNGQWQSLPGVGIAIPSSSWSRRALVQLYGSASCRGANDLRKYIRLRTSQDSGLPQDAFSAPIAPITGGTDPGTSEMSASIMRQVDIPVGVSMSITAEIYTEATSACVFNPGTAVASVTLFSQ